MKRTILVLALLFSMAVALAAAPSALIDLDASALPDGPLSSWKNAGSLTGSFDVIPVGGAVVEQVDGRNAVSFDGKKDRLVSSFAAPAEITGSHAYSFAVWARNPELQNEEAMVCWTPRSAGDGKSGQINYGSAKDFGAVTHWGKFDMGYDGGVPAAGKWHLIVVTYGGKADAVEKVYVDGKLNASEKKDLDLPTGAPIYLGCAEMEKLYSGALSAVQIYDYALSEAEIAALQNGTKPKTAALVDVSAEGLPAGQLTKWDNKGTLGGSFGTISYSPKVETVDGRKAVTFSRNGWLQTAASLPKGPFAIEFWSRITQDGAQGGTPTSAMCLGSIAKGDSMRFGLSREMKAGALVCGKVAAGFAKAPELKAWHQIAYVYGADNTLRLYVDGKLDSEKKCTLEIPSDVPVTLGAAWQPGNSIPYAWLDGSISKLAVYNEALSQRDIRAHNGMKNAFSPSPAEDGTAATLSATLAWQTGDPATANCEVYFGTDADLVAKADRSSSAFKQKVPAAKPEVAGVKLAIGQTYFWRVDELDSKGALVAKGDVWTFTADSGKATNPAPRAGVSAVRLGTAKLTWSPGKFATAQTIYFAPEAEWDKPANMAPKAKLSATASEFKIPVKLGYGQKYLWRVDSTNGSNPATTGDVWSFRTEEKLTDNDVTFFGISDIHYIGPDSHPANQDLIRIMNSFPGTPYPTEVGGNVATPRGVVATGDITNSGKAQEWEAFVQDYGLKGEASLVYPFYELWGNHDGKTTDIVPQGIKARNPTRPGVTNISKNGFHYSWDWGKVHFAVANIYPGNVSKIVIPNDPIYSMEFLKQDLEKNVGTSGRPVVILMHYGLDGGGAGWWTKEEQNEFYDTIKKYNVVLMLFGHTHGGGNYKWNGIDMVNVGASLAGDSARQFVVFHITDKELVVARRYPDKWGTILRKPITGMGAK